MSKKRVSVPIYVNCNLFGITLSFFYNNRLMDFKFTSEQQLMRQMFRDFVDKEVKPIATQIDEQKRVPDGLIKKAVELGIFGVKFPEEYGGGGAGEIGYSILCEELGRGSASFAA